MFENTDFVINRYRKAMISLDYYGDSVMNSVGDVLAMVFGFVLAARLSVWATIALIMGLEVVVIYPFEAIKAWQLGG